MIKVYTAGEGIGMRGEPGIIYKSVETGKEAGVLTGSVGLYGTSTGIFETMKTTAISEVVEVV